MTNQVSVFYICVAVCLVALAVCTTVVKVSDRSLEYKKLEVEEEHARQGNTQVMCGTTPIWIKPGYGGRDWCKGGKE